MPQPALGGLLYNLIGLAGGVLEGLVGTIVARMPACESNLGLAEEPCDEITDVVGLAGVIDDTAAA